MCIRIYGTFNVSTTKNILSSESPPDISFIILAPHPTTASLAISALKVSTEIIASGNFLFISFTAFKTRLLSSSTEISFAPGRDEYPPISRISAPSSNILVAVTRISSSVL